ncbi:hypothetical protein OK18_19085 [Chryseobacterium gallinarum]|uniref:DUF6046 domain-containing protein n=1 Tax=Chryseobacterium gallinarum TaxID=1324352 RepID=A0A0G3MBF6_CHRGL|nr:DUF6046 domain-containing protein [Chryseobacterium gallinarum]AKK74437.1 hypothetical protein OK18_19085 [Chryseobacterium gallinarum]
MTPTTANVINIYKLYGEVFGRHSYHVPESKPLNIDVSFSGIPQNERPKGTIHYGSRFGQSFNKVGAYGQDIWFPIKLTGSKLVGGKIEPIELPIDICTVSVNLMSTIVNTPVVERKGTVTEIINIEDYKFTIRGFLIGKNRTVPEQQILDLVALKESTFVKTLQGGYAELFLPRDCRIVISELEFPEVQGQNHWIRPFQLTCKSDFITDLEFL